jgi:membrane protease subunit (stomatin/prohibitin family)
MTAEGSRFMLLEVIEGPDFLSEEMVRRCPDRGSADIKMGAQLVVQQNQSAIFCRDGTCLDIVGPGRHVLSTMNLPILTRLLALPCGFRSPFRAAVCFVNRGVFADMKWSTKNPLAFRDPEFGPVRLRGCGRFCLRVENPLLFVEAVAGGSASFSVTEIEDFFRDVLGARLKDIIGEQARSLLDLPALYNEIGTAAKVRLRDDFRRYGCELEEFCVNSITPPDVVQQMVEQRTGLQLSEGTRVTS